MSHYCAYPNCGAAFEPANTRQRYCKAGHRVAAFRHRQFAIAKTARLATDGDLL
jgi:hypothetical protein